MKIFFDENFSPYLAHGFRSFQAGRPSEEIEVLHLADTFDHGTPDEAWIPALAKMHAVAVTQDFNLCIMKMQWQLCVKYKIGIFFLRPPKKKKYGYWDLVDMVLKHWRAMKDITTSEDRPFAYQITPRSTKPEPM